MSLTALVLACAPAVAPATMLALIDVESRSRPFSIGIHIVGPAGNEFRLGSQPRDRQEAERWARWLWDRGYRFDAGIAQINSANFGSLALRPENVFDVCTNIRASATILSDCFVRAQRQFKHPQASLGPALSCYQSGNFRTGLMNGYVARVARAAAALGQ